MKTLMIVWLWLAASVGYGQIVYTKAPPSMTVALTSDDGATYEPMTGASGEGVIWTSAPPPFVPVCTSNGGVTYSQCTFSGGGGGSGTVTSVAMTVPAWLTVTGSPITVSGTLAVTGTSETANYFLAAPNGSAGAMTPRAIVAADIPTLNQSTTGNAATATNLASYPTLCSGSQFSQGLSSGSNNCATPSGSGAVSSVSNSDGTLTISPTTGAVVASLALGHANTWTGLQTLVGTDITGLPLTSGVTGLLPVANGGTGTASPALVAGTNVTITGSWPNQTINSSGSGSGTITASPQHEVPFYSASGTASTLTGDEAFTDNGAGAVGVASLNNLLFSAFATNNENLGGSLPGSATGHDITCSGVGACAATTLGTQDTAYGQGALLNSTTGAYNTGTGSGALELCVSCTYNTATGVGALYTQTATVGASAYGYGAAGTSTATIDAFGYLAAGIATTATNLAAFGNGALANDVTGGSNSAFGNAALGSTTGGLNTCAGTSCLFYLYGGSGNTALGYEAGANASFSVNRTTANSVFIGAYASTSTDGLTNQIAIGYQAESTASNQTVIGTSATTSLKLYGCPTGETAYNDGSGTCYTPSSGGSGISGLTSGYIPLAGSATTITANSHLDDGVTTSGTITSSEPITVTGSTHGITIPAGTSVSGVAGSVIYSTDATNGYAEVNENNTGLERVCTATNAVCSTSGGTVTTSGTPTTNTLPLFTGSTVIGNSLLSDNGTTAAYSGTGGMNLSGSGAKMLVGASAPSVTVGTAGGMMVGEGTAPTLTGNTGNDGWYANSTSHCVDLIAGTVDQGCAAAASVSNAITSATGGSGTGTVTCLLAVCTNLRGTYSVAGGTFTTGTFLTLVWPTTTTAYGCTVTQNGLASFGFGHSVATATGMTISTTATIAATTVTFDYSCQK